VGLWLDEELHSCAHCRREGHQRDRGCPELGDSHPGISYRVGEEIINHCLVALITGESLAWLNEQSYVEAGILPEAGGLNQQMEIDLQAFAIIQSEEAVIRERKRRDR
jgi:hypothetical protein